MKLRFAILALAALILGALIFGAVVAEAAFGPNDLIPRRVLFGNPERSTPLVSPDGTRIVYAAPVDGVMNLWVAPTNDLGAAKPVTREKRRPIMKYRWAANGTHVLYLQDREGDENFHIFSVDLEDNSVRDLTPYKSVRAEILATSYARPDEVLVALNNRDPRWHDAWIIDVTTGEAELVQENDGMATFVADNDLELRLAVKPLPDGGQEYLRPDGEDEEGKALWTTFQKVGGDDALTTEPLFFTADNKQLYLLDSRDRDTGALVSLDMKSGKAKPVAESEKSDIADVIKNPETKEILAYATQYERTEWTPLKAEVKADIDFLNKQVTGYWMVLSQSRNNKLWTLWIDNSGEPIKFALYDRTTRSLKTLFTARPSLEGAPLPKTTPQVIKARDGLDLVSYVTLPKGSDTDGDGTPDKPLPMVLSVHGGPWGRDTLAYNPLAAWLANRGYAVMTVNFRGSTGFGKAFVNAGDKEWGGKMHNDLIDAVDWAIGAGIAQKDKVAIYGASYGGYATLVALTFTPKKFACGIDIVGPSNLNTMLSNVPPYWASFLATFKRRVGNPDTAAGKRLLQQRSPLFRAANIRRPLLIGQGANDPRVKQSEADQIVRTMTKNNLPVTYALYADEGHGFARPENRLSFFAISESFLKQCLGGRAEPIGGDFAGASISVPAGKQHIEGLKEALDHP